jgi:hypothetical protein
MDIYIIQDGERKGPYTVDQLQSQLKDRQIFLEDMAWRKGLPGWLPLSEVLESGSLQLDLPPPVSGLSGIASSTRIPSSIRTGAKTGMAASPKVHALLQYVGISVPPNATRDDLAVLLCEAYEKPAYFPKLSRWSEDKFRLHPELFTDELEVKKENRTQHYFEVGTHEGADIFKDLTKAHCAVLIQYLDTKHPGWERHPQEAVWEYFFPAIAEKFGDLVLPGWHGRLHYRTAQKNRAGAPRVQAGAMPVAGRGAAAAVRMPIARPVVVARGNPVFRGVKAGAMVLGVLVGVLWMANHRDQLLALVNPAKTERKPDMVRAAEPTVNPTPSQTGGDVIGEMPLVPPAQPETSQPTATVAVVKPVEPTPAAGAGVPELFPGSAPAMTPPESSPAVPAPMNGGDPSMNPSMNGATASGSMNTASSMSPPAPVGLPPAVGVGQTFDPFGQPTPGSGPVTTTPAVPQTPTTVATPKRYLSTVRSVEGRTNRGKMTIPANSPLTLVRIEGQNLHVRFKNLPDIMVIPASATDFNEWAAAQSGTTPAAPSPSTITPPSLPPQAPGSIIAPPPMAPGSGTMKPSDF